MVKDIKKGIYIVGDGSFSIDQQRYNFQFGGQLFYEIKDGKITQPMLEDVAYQANTHGILDRLQRRSATSVTGAWAVPSSTAKDSRSQIQHRSPTVRATARASTAINVINHRTQDRLKARLTAMSILTQEQTKRMFDKIA